MVFSKKRQFFGLGHCNQPIKSIAKINYLPKEGKIVFFSGGEISNDLGPGSHPTNNNPAGPIPGRAEEESWSLPLGMHPITNDFGHSKPT